MTSYNVLPIVVKNTMCDIKSSNGIFAMSSMQGFRSNMEDSHIYINMGDYEILGVFDGHGGNTCSKFCADNFEHIYQIELTNVSMCHSDALINTFKILDNEYKIFFEEYRTNINKPKLRYAGSTALVAIITQTHFIVAHAGDSRALLIDSDTKSIEFSTIDHSPSNLKEYERIRSCGLTVTNGRIRIAGGSLAMSRSIGDYEYKNMKAPPELHAVTCIPDVAIIERKSNHILVLACDGIYEDLQNKQVMQYILYPSSYIFKHSVLRKTNLAKNNHNICKNQIEEIGRYAETLGTHNESLAQLCENIIDIALDAGSCDNITIAVFDTRDTYKN